MLKAQHQGLSLFMNVQTLEIVLDESANVLQTFILPHPLVLRPKLNLLQHALNICKLLGEEGHNARLSLWSLPVR